MSGLRIEPCAKCLFLLVPNILANKKFTSTKTRKNFDVEIRIIEICYFLLGSH